MPFDVSTRFLFRDTDVRGNLLSLDASYREILETNDYPPAARQLLGQFLAGALLLSETIKFKGRLLLQARTDGPIKLLMAEANNNREVRGIVRLDESQPLEGDFPVLFYGGTLAVIMEPEKGESYQSLVPLQGNSLEDCLEHYFQQSEQLNTMIRLFADDDAAGGFLMQQLPPQIQQDRKARERTWEHLSILADTITDEEMMSLDHQQMVKRLFVEETIEVFAGEEVTFACSCSEERLANSLVSLGRQELNRLFREEPELTLTCEFCQQVYRFDEERLMQLVVGNEERH